MAADTSVFVGDGDAINALDMGKLLVSKITLDCSDDNIASGDTVKLWEMQDGIYVIDVVVNVTTAEGGTLTIDVGDFLLSDGTTEVDADGYHDGLNGNSAAATATRAQLAEDTTAVVYAEGKYYTDALNMIGALFNNAADTAVIEFILIALDCRGR